MSKIPSQPKRSGLLLELMLLLLAVGVAFFLAQASLRVYYHTNYPLKYQSLVEEVCARQGADPALIYAVMRTESGFQPDARSSVGAMGLMQMTDDAYQWMRMRRGEQPDEYPERLYEPAVNVEYATAMLLLLQNEFGSVDKALAAYHAGRGSVHRWLSDPAYSSDGVTLEHIPFADTRAYVAKVRGTIASYNKLYNFKEDFHDGQS